VDNLLLYNIPGHVVEGQYKTWTLDSGLDHRLDSWLNDGLDIWTRFSITGGQRSCQINQQQSFAV